MNEFAGTSKNKASQIGARLKSFLFFLSIAVLLHVVLALLFHPTRQELKEPETNSLFTVFINEDDPVLANMRYELTYDDPTLLIHPKDRFGFNLYHAVEPDEEYPKLLPDAAMVLTDVLKKPGVEEESVSFDVFNGETMAYRTVFQEIPSRVMSNPDDEARFGKKQKTEEVKYPCCTFANGGIIDLEISGNPAVSMEQKPVRPGVYRMMPFGEDALLPNVRLVTSCGNGELDSLGMSKLEKLLISGKLLLQTPEYVYIVWLKPEYPEAEQRKNAKTDSLADFPYPGDEPQTGGVL